MPETTEYQINNNIGNKLRIVCSSCDCTTNHTVQTNFSKYYSLLPKEGEHIDSYTDYQIIQCDGCDEISFRRIYTNSEALVPVSDNFGNVNIEAWEDIALFPPRFQGRKPLSTIDLFPVPHLLREIYAETHTALINNQLLLMAVGLRALTEGICDQQIKTEEEKSAQPILVKYRGTEKNLVEANLYTKIEWLVQQGLLAQASHDILHTVRTMGNDSVHDIEKQDIEQLKLALEVLESLMKTLYIFPTKHKFLLAR